MTHEEIMEMAREASSMARLPWNGEWIFRSKKELMAFASLVAAKEREVCALVCEAKAHEVRLWCNKSNVIACAAAIRSRGTKEGV